MNPPASILEGLAAAVRAGKLASLPPYCWAVLLAEASCGIDAKTYTISQATGMSERHVERARAVVRRAMGAPVPVRAFTDAGGGLPTRAASKPG